MKLGSWKKRRMSRSDGRGEPAAGGHAIVRMRSGSLVGLCALGLGGPGGVISGADSVR